MYTDFDSVVVEQAHATTKEEADASNMYLPIKSYTTPNDYEFHSEEEGSESDSDSSESDEDHKKEDANNFYVILSEDSTKKAKKPIRPKVEVFVEENATKLIAESDAEFLKETLIAHSKDHRVHMLSYVLESIQKHRRNNNHEAGEQAVEGPEQQKRRTNLREWNQEMQNVLGSGLGARTSSTGVLHELGHDFVNIAETYAKYSPLYNTVTTTTTSTIAF